MNLESLTERANACVVEQCLQGNQAAWFALIERYKDLIFSVPIKYGIPPQDAADIFQGVCLDLFTELPHLRDPESLQAWLIRVAIHKCYHWRRNQTPQASGWDEAGVNTMWAEGCVSATMVEELEREQLVRDAIASLPARCKQMIQLLFFEQPPLRYRELAQRLGLATGSIGFIRQRCLKRLKRILQEKGF